ncbi:MAG: zinc-ribbon domain-containing protein [Promethearchaeota archaeon]
MPSCPYCGKAVQETDKFCLYCGEPLVKVQSPPASTSGTQIPSSTPSKGGYMLFPQAQVPPQESEEIEDDEVEIEEETPEELEEKESIQKEAESPIYAELDPEVKEEIEARIALFELASKIKKVKDKINETIKMMDDPEFKDRYDYDDEFRSQHSIRFDALKQIALELKKQKEELESKISDMFILDARNKEIIQLKQRIKLLENSYKLKQIDKKSYESIYDEYREKLKDLVKERDKDNAALRKWAATVKIEIQGIKEQIKMLKARKIAREISKEEFKEEKGKMEREMQKLKNKVRVIESFIHTD